MCPTIKKDLAWIQILKREVWTYAGTYITCWQGSTRTGWSSADLQGNFNDLWTGKLDWYLWNKVITKGVHRRQCHSMLLVTYIAKMQIGQSLDTNHHERDTPPISSVAAPKTHRDWLRSDHGVIGRGLYTAVSFMAMLTVLVPMWQSCGILCYRIMDVLLERAWTVIVVIEWVSSTPQASPVTVILSEEHRCEREE